MSHEVKSLGETEAEITITIGAEELASAIEGEVRKLAPRVELPGFRKGKVPLQVVRKKFGKAIEAEARQNALETEYGKALDESSLKPLEAPELDPAALVPNDDGALEVTFKFEVIPEFELGGYKGLTVSTPAIELNEEDVAKELENLRQQAGHVHDVEGASEAGDVIEADVVYQFLDGTALPPMASQWIDTEQGAIQGMACEAVVDKFTGVSTGDEVKLTVDLEKPFPIEEHHGKTAVAQCTVKSVKRRHLPAADDPEFLKNFGAESLVDLETRIRENMQVQMNSRRDAMIEDMCIDHLLERHEFPLPGGHLEKARSAERDRIRHELGQRGASAEDAETHLLEIEGRLMEGTEKKVRASVMLDRIAAEEGLQVQDEDMQRHFAAMSQALQIPAQQLFDKMRENGSLSGVLNGLLRDKTRRFLREHAVSTDQKDEGSSETEEASKTASEQESS